MIAALVLVAAAVGFVVLRRRTLRDQPPPEAVAAQLGQRVQVGGQGGNQSLTFTGLHLGDVSQVQRGTTHDLDVEVTHAKGALRRFAHGGECLWKEVVEALARSVAGTECRSLIRKLGVGQFRELFFEGVDAGGDGAKLGEYTAFTSAQYLVENVSQRVLQTVSLYPSILGESPRPSGLGLNA